jgi:putative oxidoreductase
MESSRKRDIGQDYGALVLRLGLGAVLLAHSLYLKLMVFTLGGTAQFFESIGLAGSLAYVVFFIEAIAGILLILGYQVRAVALVVLPILLGASWAHWPNGWLFTATNGGWEYPLFLAVIAVAVALIGSGEFVLFPGRKQGLHQDAQKMAASAGGGGRPSVR